MAQTLVRSGIPCVDDIPWGTHFCQFYETGTDLADTLVPYFKTGLEANEGCLWITSEPFTVSDATNALRAAVPDLDARMARGQIEILDHRDWYTRTGHFEADAVLRGSVAKKEQAEARGYGGLRLTGNTFWLESDQQYRDFLDYESRLNEGFKEHRMICVCSYCLGRARAANVLDVVRNHEFAVARREGSWDVVESASLKVAKQELSRAYDAIAHANQTLEERVRSRTAELEQALSDKDTLLKEVHHRVNNNLQVINSMLLLKAQGIASDQVRSVFNDVQDRVMAMSLVHEMLYQKNNASRINFSQYLRTLGEALVESYGAEDRIRFDVATADGCVGLENAIPLGLAATEAITNALKHAFPGARDGHIRASYSASASGEGGELVVRDDGVGMAPVEPVMNSGRLGLTLLSALAAQLGGRATHASPGGTLFVLRY